jgi:lysozyme
MLNGIDVHDKKGTVAWDQVAAAGQKFAFVRGAYGDVADTLVQQNYNGANDNQLYCGLYHFLRTSRPYPAQLQAMLTVLDKVGVGSGDLPPVIDVEDNPNYDGPWDRANNASYLDAVRTWLTTMQTKFNCAPIIYTRASFWELLGNPPGFSNYRLWVSNYGVVTPKLPTGWNRYDFWQQSENGKVAGVTGGCDIDVFNGNDDDLDKLSIP